MRSLEIAAVVVAASVTLMAQDAGPRRDGNWQVTVETEIPGMPQRMPPATMTQCLTKADVADPTKAVPQAPGRGAMPGCTIADYRTVGNKVSWSMACGGENPMTGRTEFVYAGDSYVGTMTLITTRAGQPMTMTMKYAAKRLGDCEK